MPHTFNLRLRLRLRLWLWFWLWLWFYHWFWFWFWLWLWFWFWLRGRLRGHLYFLYYLLFYSYTTCSESPGGEGGRWGLMEAGEMKEGKRWSGWVHQKGNVRNEEFHGWAVWGNRHQMVLKQVRQQAVTGRKRSVTGGWNVIDSWRHLHCISVWWKTGRDKFYPDDINLFNLCCDRSQITLVLPACHKKYMLKWKHTIQKWQISVNDMRFIVGDCRLRLTIVFFTSIRERKEQKNIIKRSRLYPVLTEHKMWVPWGSMLSIHNTLLLVWAQPLSLSVREAGQLRRTAQLQMIMQSCRICC